MLTYEQALKRIQRATPAPQAVRIPLQQALGLVLAQPVIAPVSLPLFDNSAVDGYAIGPCDGAPKKCYGLLTSTNGNNTAAPIVLRVVGCSSAGAPYPNRLRPGEAVRIFTGAAIPRGADRIIMQEHVHRHGDSIVSERWPEAGRHIRRRGEDVRRGTRIFAAGRIVRAQDLGLLAALGYETIRVFRRPSVALLSTGDELQQPGRRLKAGQIYESNGVLLEALVHQAGARPVRMGIVRDALQPLVARLRQALAGEVEVVAVCGGVSVGERDLVRTALEACGVREQFWRVNIKPGMPLWFGRRGRTLVFGLPGNPVSAFVTFEEFVKPALCRLRGRSWQDAYTEPAVLVENLELSRSRRTHFIRVQCSEQNQLVAQPLNGQGSHHLRSLAELDGWIRVTTDGGPWRAGTQVMVKRDGGGI